MAKNLKGKCKKFIRQAGPRPIYCGMALNTKGECPEHGKGYDQYERKS